MCASRIMAKGAAWFRGFGTVAPPVRNDVRIGRLRRPAFTRCRSDHGERPARSAGVTERVCAGQRPFRSVRRAEGFGRRSLRDCPLAARHGVGPQRDVLDIALSSPSSSSRSPAAGVCVRVGTRCCARDGKIVAAGDLSDIGPPNAGSYGGAHEPLRPGQSAPNPILTTMRSFPDCTKRACRHSVCTARHSAGGLADAVQAQGREPWPRRSDMRARHSLYRGRVDVDASRQSSRACDAGIYIPRLCYHPTGAGATAAVTCKSCRNRACITPAAQGCGWR